MKKTMVTVLLIASIFLCSCANKQLPANSSPESNEAKAQLEENTNSMATEPTPDVSLDAESAFGTQDSVDFETGDILSQIKTSVGIPFRLWNNQSQVLHCISVFESYAKREVERKTDPAHEEQSELEWHITENVLSITGAWNEDFLLDMSGKTATSLTDGMVYDIVPGNIIDGHYTD